ncbi:MAG: IS66 family transposase [Opitutales bacterium]|nr:IS66 family transposase [Opitutales bacterium]
MSRNPQSTPVQASTLEERLHLLEQALAHLQAENESLRAENASLRVENAQLRLKIRALEMAQARRSPPAEDERQTLLQIQPTETVCLEIETADAPVPPNLPSSTTKRVKKKRLHGLDKLANLPVEKETVFLPEEVERNPGQWKEIRREVTHEVIFHPGHLAVHRMVRPRFVPVADREARPITAKAPARFSHDFVSASLAIEIVLSKYQEHGALHRLEQRFKRMGLDLPRQTQSDTVERFSLWVRPLYELIKQRALQTNYLQIDETFIKYINGRLSGSGQGYFWAINAIGLAMVFTWIPNRRHENAATVLDGFNGLLQSDGYAAYGNLAAARSGLVLLACWSHVFRAFRDALADEPAHAKTAMHEIGRLYTLEEKWDRQGIDEQTRKARRAEHSLPIAAQLKTRLDAWAADMTIPANKFRTAVGYTANRWEALMECLRHGHTRLDTNLLESKFRPTKIGAKNWTFIGHPSAGQKSAVIYTLLTCCRMHRIEPRAYLTDLLERIVPAEHQPGADLLEELLPWNWAKAHPHRLVKEPQAAYHT